ncbi:hypothetical protein BDY21DRAFT_389035 [Lineolata rhizophorae]|uniref:Flavin reductase like domain-containing protein n=1 Tax=Lineolata rhizophorae TaxID=578093 RepID=A0A6A6PD31_9PEZI|nr:hypothetical protein BDY21DRAFT_389035 [Lineolata rhizophorae]
MSNPDKMDSEAFVRRNPHPDFKGVEALRPDFNTDARLTFHKTPKPDWQPGGGANDGGACLEKDHVEINPYEEGRPAVFNYKLLISAIVPRPIGFVGTRSKDGTTTNLAPFSYFQIVNHDPPLFTLGYAGGFDRAKDSIRNLSESGECTINIISEHYIEAANFCSINAPYGTSEFAVSGLHPAPCTDVKAPRVRESIFSVEGKLVETREFESRATPGKKTGILAIVEGVRFWVREDALNEDKNLVDPTVLKPMARLGGITYTRITEAMELPRPQWDEAMASSELAKSKV